MADRVDAGGRSEAGRRHHLHVGVDDGHVRHDRVVGKRILRAGRLVGDDGERRHFGAGSGGGRHAHEIGLLAHLRERVDALADVHEAHRHVLEVRLGVFVEHPHDLRRVHRAAAADGDDDVRLEARHELCALLGAGEGRVGRDVGERREHDALLFERLLDGLGVAVRVEEGVGHDERLLLAEFLAEFAQGDGEAAFLLVDLFRRAEPQHVFSSHCDCLDVDEMLDADVIAHGVAAPRTAAERERRREAEVVDVADAAVRRRRVDEDAARLHARGELGELGLFAHLVEVDRRRVAVAAVRDKPLGLVERVRPVLRAVERQHGGELLVRELLGKLHAFDFAHEHLRVRRNLEPCELGDLRGLLSDDLGVQRAVDEDRLARRVELLLVKEVAAHLDEKRAHVVIHRVLGDDALLGRADHAVVERLGVDDGADRERQVGSLVDDRGRIARADAKGGRAARVRGLDHAGAAGREDDVGLLHEEVRLRERRRLDPADDALWCARLDGGVQHDLRRGDRRVLGARMRADDDAVARLKRNEALEYGRRRRVCGRDHRADDADGLGDLLDARRLVGLYNATRLGVLVGVVDVFGRVVVLYDLVLDDTHACLGHGHLRKRNPRLVRRQSRRTENRVDLRL